MFKACTKCKKTLNTSFFTKDKHKKDGLTSQCTACRYAKKIENTKSVSESNRRQREKNRNIIVSKRESPNGIAYQHEYSRKRSAIRIANYDSKKRRQYYENDKARQIENQRVYRKEREKIDIEYKLSNRLRTRLYKAIKNEYKSGSSVRDLGCSVGQLRQYLESLFRPGMTWNNWGKNKGKWQIDHIQPLCSFDLTNREQFLKACHYTNLQPLWFEDHINKTIVDMKKLAA